MLHLPALGLVVAGDVAYNNVHPDRQDDPRILDETAEYLRTARQVIAEKPTAREFFDEMTRRYPDRLNPGTVWLNAQRLA